MTAKVLGWSLLVAVSACASETKGSDASACADVTGNYSVAVERVSGTCDPALDPKTASVSVTKAGDGSYVLVAPGIEGGCPGELNEASCKITANCTLFDKDRATLGTFTVDYTFSAKGYTGSTVSGLKPPAVASACDVTYRETGTKL